VSWESPFWIIMMGIENERIHLETSSVLIRQLPLNLLKDHSGFPVCPEVEGLPPANEALDVEGGRVRLGKSKNDPYYGWDNEYGKREEEVKSFKASRMLVSHQEYLAFMEAGGYRTPDYWTEEGWSWVSYQKCSAPRFWVQKDGEWHLRLLTREIPMPWSWPVEVNYLEAKAFCQWRTQTSGQKTRLPTEAEYQLLRSLECPGDAPEWEKSPGNINLEHWASSCPVDHFPQGRFFDIVGNVWQWTETPISGYPGFEIHPLYDDFSTPTFDTKHNLIKGGSWISTGNEALTASRYAFRRHFYQHAGFRWVESDQPVVIRDDSYESDPAVVPLCAGDYLEPAEGHKPFALKLSDYLKALSDKNGRPFNKALVMGCQTGRLPFAMTGFCGSVTGLDLSARIIRFPIQLQEKGYANFVLPEEGEILQYHQVQLEEIMESPEKASAVEFWQADLTNLKPVHRGFDLAVIQDCLERVVEPARILTSAAERLLPGGILVVASSFGWDRSDLKSDLWLGGIKEAGENVSGEEAVTRLLEKDFQPLGDPRWMERIVPINGRSYEVRKVRVLCFQKKK